MSWRGLLLLLAGLLSGCSASTGLLFYPQPSHLRTPADLGLAYQNLQLQADDGTLLHAWYVPPIAPEKGQLLFLHGNAENISTHIASVAWLPRAGYGVLALDYRGFGHSQGVARLPEVFQDLGAASDWLFSHTPAPHFVLGQSLGAALALGFIDDPRSRGYSGMLLDAPFARYRDIGRYALGQGWLSRLLLAPAANLLPNDYDPLDRVAAASMPLLFFASPNDRIVPLQHSRQLFEAAVAPRYWFEHQGGHIATFQDPAARRVALQFLQQGGAEVEFEQ